tara:strand:+ start:480 stop:803 length:324 start_codon:yes stop_codon:yes gene_type:complete
MSYFIEDTNLKLSDNVLSFLNKMNRFVDFKFLIYGSDSELSFSIDTQNLNLNQISKLLNVSRNLNANYAEYDKEINTIDVIVPKKKINLGSIAVFFLIIRGALWLRK